MSNESTQLPLTVIPEKGFTSFLNRPVESNLNLLKAAVAFIGVPYGIPYEMGQSRSACAPSYIREKSLRFLRSVNPAISLDNGSVPFNLSDIDIVDCGDVPYDPGNIREGVKRATKAIEMILERGAIPFVLGGDDSIPIPVAKAYENQKPITVIQIDEHLDYADSIMGVREGYSSPMRRIGEMGWVKQIVQVGLHGYTCAKQWEAAQANGNILITTRDMREKGVQRVLDQIPDGENYLITVDFDGLDGTTFPAVSHPEPGGMNFDETNNFLCGLAGKGKIVGVDFAEMVPDHDLHGLAGHTVGHLIINMLHAMMISGQLGA